MKKTEEIKKYVRTKNNDILVYNGRKGMYFSQDNSICTKSVLKKDLYKSSDNLSDLWRDGDLVLYHNNYNIDKKFKKLISASVISPLGINPFDSPYAEVKEVFCRKGNDYVLLMCVDETKQRARKLVLPIEGKKKPRKLKK